MANRTIKIAIDLATGAGFAAGIKALNALTSAVEGFAEKAVVESVKAAAAFEKTRNTLEVFTGSTRRANAELAEISELTKSVPGLALRDAEAGTVRLRALGFAAKTAKDLVAGIGLNKLLSGSDESAVNRVITNLEQLRAGSPKIGKDIREMVQAIPTLSKVINETFGSIDKFQAAIKKNPSEALEKFAEAAKNTKIGNAGLSASIIDLENSFERAQRLFGEPLLEPLTESVKNLTKFLENNKETWRSWGQYVADVISGINAPDTNIVPTPQQSTTVFGDIFDPKFQYKTQSEIYEAYKAGKLQGYVDYSQKSNALTIRNLIETATGGADSLTGMSKIKEYQRVGEDRRLQKVVDDFNKSRTTADFGTNLADFINQRSGLGGKTPSEIAADNKAAQDKLNEDKERARQEDLASLRRNADASAALLKTRYDNEQAMLDSNIRYTEKEELAYLSKSAQIKQNFYTSERARINGYYSKVIALTENGSDEQLKAEADRTKELAKLNAQEVQDAYKAKRQILEFERKVQDERRQNLLEFNSLQVTMIQQGGAKQNFEIQRALETGAVSYEQYFDKQIGLANESLNSLLEINRKSLALELQNKSLTAEEITNIRKKSLLEEERLIEENAENIYRIQREAIERQKDLINTYAQFRSNIITSASEIQGGFADLFFGNRSTSGQSKTAANALLDGYRRDFNELSQEIEKYRQKAHAEDVRLGILNKNKSVISTQANDASAEIQKAQADLKSLEDNLKNLSQGVAGYEQGGRFALDVASGKLYDTVKKKLVENKMDNGEAIAALENQINQQKNLIAKLTESQQSFSQAIADNAQQTDNGFWLIVRQLEGDLKSLERYKELLTSSVKIFDGFKATPEGVDDLQMRFLKNRNRSQIESLNAQIEAQRSIRDSTDETLQKQKESLRLTELEQQAEAVKIRQFAEEEELYRKAIPGLRAYIQALTDGDKQATAFARNAAVKNILEDQARLLEENIFLQEKLSRAGQDSAARYKNAWLSAQLEIREATVRANESIIRSNVLLDDAGNIHSEQVKARILEHLAQQKTQSEITADAIINVYDKASSGIDKLLDKSFLGRVPILGDVAKGYVKNQFTNLFRSQLDRFFPGLGEQFEKTGNPMIDKLTESINIQKQIEANTRGGKVRDGDIIDGVVQVVASDQKGGGSWLQKLKSIFFGGGSNVTGGQVFGSGQNPNNPLIWHMNGQLPTNGSAGDLLRFLTPQPIPGRDFPTSGGGSILDKIFGKGGLFGSKGFGMNAGTAGGIGSLAMLLGGAIGGRFGETLSYAGLGANLGSNFGIFGAAIGAVAGLGFGLFKSLFGRGNAESALKKAAKTAYGIDVKDRSILQTLKAIGEAKFGKGSVGRKGIAEQVVRLPESVELLQSYSDSSGQKGNNALNLSRLADENYRENYSSSTFSGFGAGGSIGGSIVSSYANRPAYLFSVPANSFNAGAMFSNATPFQGINSQMNQKFEQYFKQMVALLNSVAQTNDAVAGNTSKLSLASPHDIVTIGAETASEAIANSFENSLAAGGARRSETLYRNSGRY